MLCTSLTSIETIPSSESRPAALLRLAQESASDENIEDGSALKPPNQARSPSIGGGRGETISHSLRPSSVMLSGMLVDARSSCERAEPAAPEVPVEPTGTAGLAGLMELLDLNLVDPGETHAVLFTGVER